VIAGPQPRPIVLYNSLQHMFPPKRTQALLFQRVTPVCTCPGFKLRIFSDLRTVVLQFPVFVVRLFELCRAFSVRCALCTEKGWGEGGVIFRHVVPFLEGAFELIAEWPPAVSPRGRDLPYPTFSSLGFLSTSGEGQRLDHLQPPHLY